MKRTYTLIDLDCATCAALMEDSIRKIEGIDSVSISFMTSRMVIEGPDITASLLNEVRKRIKKVNPDTTF